jgi:pimeloyl-ACP methyl ester carboxylesterase
MPVSTRDVRRRHPHRRDGHRPRPPASGFARALCTAHDWQPLADVLASHVTTYAVDRRGHGASGDGTDFSIDREQEDMAAVLDLTGPDAVLLGHSYGGLVALGTAQQRPPTALILCEPPLPLPGTIGGTNLPAFEQAVAAGDLDHALTLGLRNFLKLPDEAITAFRQDVVWSVRASMTPPHGPVKSAPWTQYGDDLQRFATTDTPTLLIIGELSPPWLTNTTRQLHQALPNSRLIQIPRQAHDAYLTDPNALAAAILDFIQ